MLGRKILTSLYFYVLHQNRVSEVQANLWRRISQKSDELTQPDVLAPGKFGTINNRLDLGMIIDMLNRRALT